MELRDALTQITEIHQRVAQTQTFHGYRAVPIAFTGILAFGAAGVQSSLVPEPAKDVASWLALWLSVAALSVLATGGELLWSWWRSPSCLEREKTLVAVAQFAPCLLAGALLLLVVVRAAPELCWLLPGLWAMFFGLGIFASCRCLPRGIVAAGGFYLFAGALCLGWARGASALSPWAMGLPFGVGQLLVAGVLYWRLERVHEQQ